LEPSLPSHLPTQPAKPALAQEYLSNTTPKIDQHKSNS
ncbi:hypothetical protein V495_07394, partial [Pseudogymnoascus sp. VKM F-4514 (FW-929)]